jgi:hypothetical protein
MAVRGEEVANSIESHVRSAVEKLVEEINSSVEDIRETVDQQLKAALQSVRADVKSLSVLPHVQKVIGEWEESISASRPAPAAGGDSARLKRAVQAVERGKSQVDILNALLDQCLDFGSRAALLILRGETFSGWKGVGFSGHGGSDDMIKRFNAAPGLIPELDLVLRQERIADWDGTNLSTRFGVATSTRAILVPMVIKDKVAAAVYVDAVQDDLGKLDRPAIELLVFTTGLLIDTIAIRKKTPSPSMSDDGDSRPATAAAAPHPAPPQPLAPQPAHPQPPAAAPAPAPRAPQPATSATVAINAQQIREMMATPAPAAEPAPPPRSVAPPAAPPATPPVSALPSEERPSTQFIPPAGLSTRTNFSGGTGDEAKKHDEARRFARLLVSEIKLYNESKVEQGRRSKNIYERLKEDIDRSRQMYDARIEEDVRKKSNYFHDELVRILADGSSDALGM